MGLVIGALGEVVSAMIDVWRFDPKQFPDHRDIGRAVAVSEEPVVANAMLAFWEHMDQEPADELVCLQGHGDMPLGAVDAIILDAESDALVVRADQAAVGDCDPVGVTRKICQHGFGSGEGFFGIDDPIDFAQRLKECIEGVAVGEVHVIAEEPQFPDLVQLDQPFQNETPVQTGQHAHG